MPKYFDYGLRVGFGFHAVEMIGFNWGNSEFQEYDAVYYTYFFRSTTKHWTEN
jgi:hypothetical protein